MLEVVQRQGQDGRNTCAAEPPESMKWENDITADGYSNCASDRIAVAKYSKQCAAPMPLMCIPLRAGKPAYSKTVPDP